MATPTAQFVELWRRLSFSKRVVVIGAALGTLALMGVLIMYGSQPEYAVLFHDLQPAAAPSIVEKLKTSKASNQISTNRSLADLLR